MLFDLQLLGKPDANGNAAVVESRTHAGASVEEAVRSAKIIVQSTSVPGTYGFRLIRNGLEVFFGLMSKMPREVKQAVLSESPSRYYRPLLLGGT
jgi:hypothetical protein